MTGKGVGETERVGQKKKKAKGREGTGERQREEVCVCMWGCRDRESE